MTDQRSVPPPISTVDELLAALQLAVGVELSTIPVYLTALYSIQDGHNTDAAQAIRSVVMEEMLHMTLAANVLNALGHPPSTNPVDFKTHKQLDPIPAYPLTSPLITGLGTLTPLPFTPAAVESFVRIEHPFHGADSLHQIPTTPAGYQTIGQFYDAIATALGSIAGLNFSHGNQVPDTQYYGGAGQVIEVIDQESAKQAIHKIVAEGEGLPAHSLEKVAKEAVADGDQLHARWAMYSHYARFRELQTGRRFRSNQLAEETPKGAMLLVDYDAVHPARYVPRDNQHTQGVEDAALAEFDLTYSQLVDDLYHALATPGAGGTGQTRFTRAVHTMYILKNMAVGLMRTPNPAYRESTLCPRFSYIAPTDRNTLRAHAENLRGQAK